MFPVVQAQAPHAQAQAPNAPRTVAEAADEIRDLFPDLDLTGLINANMAMIADNLVAHIIDNLQNIPKKADHCVDMDQTANCSMLDVTLEPLSDEDCGGVAELVPAVDVGIKAVLDALLGLFRRDMAVEPPAIMMKYHIERSNILCYFRKVKVYVLKQIWSVTNHRVEATAVICFFVENISEDTDQFRQIQQDLSLPDATIRTWKSLVRTCRPPPKSPSLLLAELQHYDDFMRGLCGSHPGVLSSRCGRYVLKKSLELDDTVTSNSAPQTTFECCVCYDEVPIRQGFECAVTGPSSSGDAPTGGHMCCVNCLRMHAESATTNAAMAPGGIGLRCVEHGCANALLFADIRRYLHRDTRKKLHARVVEENLGMAKLDNLERCIRCNFAVEMEVPPDVDKVFKCLNPKCRHEYCRICERDWRGVHFGFSCKELDEKDQNKQQRELEKKLTDAVIRRCPNCNLVFVKEPDPEGKRYCNKMTCRCGLTQCYICRKTGIDYKHFCQHVRDPRNPTVKCTECVGPSCLLWEDPERRDAEVLKAIQAEHAPPAEANAAAAAVPAHPN